MKVERVAEETRDSQILKDVPRWSVFEDVASGKLYMVTGENGSCVNVVNIDTDEEFTWGGKITAFLVRESKIVVSTPHAE